MDTRLDNVDEAIKQLIDKVNELISDCTQTASRQVAFGDMDVDHAYTRTSRVARQTVTAV